jgi:uncharacterized protein YutE (UPF0331/DUF86 family)
MHPLFNFRNLLIQKTGGINPPKSAKIFRTINRANNFREKQKYFAKIFREQKYFAQMNFFRDKIVLRAYHIHFYCRST